MSVPAKRFGEYLAEDESVVHEAPGTFIDEQDQSEGAIGVTDRRVVFLSEGNRFVDVSHDAIYSIQSRPRTTYTNGAIGYRLLVVLGVLVAVPSFLAVVGLGPGNAAFVLAAVTVGAAVGAEYARRNDVDADVDWSGLVDRLPVPDGALRRLATVTRDHGNGKPLVFGLAYVGLAGVVGLVVVTGSLAVVPLVVLTLGGLALADGAVRRTREFDRLGRSRRREREVHIHLADGRRVRLRVEESGRLDRELSGVARDVERPAPEAELARSASSRSRG